MKRDRVGEKRQTHTEREREREYGRLQMKKVLRLKEIGRYREERKKGKETQRINISR